MEEKKTLSLSVFRRFSRTLINPADRSLGAPFCARVLRRLLQSVVRASRLTIIIVLQTLSTFFAVTVLELTEETRLLGL